MPRTPTRIMATIICTVFIEVKMVVKEERVVSKESPALKERQIPVMSKIGPNPGFFFITNGIPLIMSGMMRKAAKIAMNCRM